MVMKSSILFASSLGIMCSMSNMKKLLCKLGFHIWEKEPFYKEFIRSTGIHFFFFSTGIQTGIQKCSCCTKTRYVLREGILGAGESGKWRATTKQHADEINQQKPF